MACSRQTFAFSRDGALPFSRYLYRMNSYTQTPVNCVWAATFVGLVLGLLAFAGPTAINAIFSLGVVGSYLAYCIPISSRLICGARWQPGPFSLGILVSVLSTSSGLIEITLRRALPLQSLLLSGTSLQSSLSCFLLAQIPPVRR